MPYLKKYATKIILEFADGTTMEHKGVIRYNQTENRRSRNKVEWDEYHVTWFVDRTDPVEEVVPEMHKDLSLQEYREKYGNMFAGVQDGKPFYHQPIDLTDFGLDDVWKKFENSSNE